MKVMSVSQSRDARKRRWMQIWDGSGKGEFLYVEAMRHKRDTALSDRQVRAKMLDVMERSAPDAVLVSFRREYQMEHHGYYYLLMAEKA